MNALKRLREAHLGKNLLKMMIYYLFDAIMFD